MPKIVQETLPFKDAMDNLARLAALDLSGVPRFGIVRKRQIITDEAEFPEVDILWLTEEGLQPLLDVFDLTLQSVHEHLIHELKGMDWNNEKSRQALESTMSLCSEAAHRLEKGLEMQMGTKVQVLNRPAMQALQEDYARFGSKLKQEEPPSAGDPLQDLEMIRQDLDYELFYIRKEDGHSYFSPDLLRHMRLISDFESEGESFEEDPLLQVRSMMDRDLQSSAKQILGNCHDLITDFYKIYKRLANNDLASMLSQSVMALLLAGNQRNLLQNTLTKSCQQYFDDFLFFLKSAFRTDEYQKFIAYPPEKSEKIPHLLLNLAHMLSHELYVRAGGVKQEAVGLIHRTTRKGSESAKAVLKKGETIWNQLSIDDENYRSRLAKFPSGPLFKTLDLVRAEESESVPFDPMIQGNIPMQLYSLQAKGKQIQFLRLACPTRQSVINKAEILDEMRGFLRFYNSGTARQKHLLINLQDRTSWKEFIRCKVVEEMQKNAEFNPSLVVVTLAKNTDFYFQANEYENIDRATEFFQILVKQFEETEGTGFYFPSFFKTADRVSLINELIPIIHRHFFSAKQTLTRHEREDFIEIVYQFLVLKLIDLTNPTSVSFTCKDAVDTGSAASALFYALIHLLRGDGFEEKKNIDYFRWLLYAPALFVRERPLDPERFNRVVTVLERVDEGLQGRGKVLQEMDGLFSSKFLGHLGVL